MEIVSKLSSSLGRRDEIPNKKLAFTIAKADDRSAVQELVDNLDHEDKRIQSDCIKVLYEIGERKPELIASYCSEFGKLLESKNNRLAWGAMTALDTITHMNPGGVFKVLPRIVAAADGGSVITRDHAVSILAKLGTLKKYSAVSVPLLMEQLSKCPANQLPMYAEMSIPVVDEKNRKQFAKVFSSRLATLEKDSQRKRIQKVIKRIESE